MTATIRQLSARVSKLKRDGYPTDSPEVQAALEALKAARDADRDAARQAAMTEPERAEGTVAEVIKREAGRLGPEARARLAALLLGGSAITAEQRNAAAAALLRGAPR